MSYHTCDLHDHLNDERDIAVYKVTRPNGAVEYYCEMCYNHASNAVKSLPVVSLVDAMDLSFGKKKSRRSKKSQPKKSRRSRSRKSSKSSKKSKSRRSRSRKSSSKRRSKRSKRSQRK